MTAIGKAAGAPERRKSRRLLPQPGLAETFGEEVGFSQFSPTSGRSGVDDEAAAAAYVSY